MYFIGVMTTRSSIMRVFPQWAEYMGFGECRIAGMDLKLHDEPESYRRAVSHIKNDPLSLGALVTTHKLDLLRACRDLFEEVDELADLTEEVSSVSRRGGKLVGHAKDPITAGLALEAFLPQDHWIKTGAATFIIGVGGLTS
jgi:shikimate 5-dehydrogenase